MKRILLSLALGIAFFFTASAQNFYIQEDFNNSSLPTGWATATSTGTQTWSFGIDGSIGSSPKSPGIQNIDGTPLAFFDDDVLGLSAVDSTVTITTPAFDNSAVPISFLEFDYNFKEYAGIPDSFFVDVFDGTNWNRVFSRATDDCGHYVDPPCRNGFPHAFIDISAFKNANCRVRFSYYDAKDWGWYVGLDNVEIWSPLPNDIAVTSVRGPESGCGLGLDTVVAVISNLGFNAATGFNVVFNVNNGTQIVTESITTSIATGDSLVYTFNGLANLTSVGTYDIDVYTVWASDGAAFNDTTRRVVISEQTYTPTYSEDFETPGSAWKVEGVNASWQRGVPNNASISVAASGQNAFVTRLTGNYNPNERSYLVSPCLDFSGSTADPILNFSLIHLTETGFDRVWMEYSFDNGQTWTKLQRHPTFNPTNWYNNAAGQYWEGISGGWIAVENRLNGFAGQSQVKLRVAFLSDGSTQLEGVGIDKFSIRDPQPVDLSVNRILYPTASATPLCGYGTENIIVEYENKGTTNINTIYFSYRVDNGQIYRDTVNNTNVLPGQILTYQFTRRQNFGGIRNYIVQAWGKSPGDSFSPNDTVPTVIVSNTSVASAFSIPYSQDFDAMTPGGPPNQGWTRDPDGAFIQWVSSNGGTPSLNTGPDQDATGGNFWFMETSGNTTPQPLLISPCINLSNNNGARLVYAYHMFGATMGSLFVDVFDGIQWVNSVDVITGQQQTSGADPWLYREVNLNQYAGRRIKIRFRGNRVNSFTSDMAIDDILIFEPLPRDVEMKDVVAPFAGCEVSSTAEVVVEIYNPGTLDTKPDSVYVYYQIDSLPPVKDTVPFIIPSENSANFTFSQTADMGIAGKIYTIKTWVDMIGDQLDDNDTIFAYKVRNYLRTPNYFENFETFRTALCDQPLGQVIEEGWSAPQDEFSWNVQETTCGQGGTVTPTTNTGPSGDHTTGRGIFMYTEQIDIDGVGGIGNNTALLESPCIDLTGTNQARLSFWYHKFGSQMGNLFFDVFHNGSWILGVDQINGQTQTSANAPWKVRHVNLDAYTGSLVQFRFRGQRGGDRCDMAIDDVLLYKPNDQDVGINVVTSPNGDNCNLGQAPVTMQVQNFGSQPIAANSIRVSYSINNGPKIVDTIPNALAVNATANFTFPGTVDMSTPGTKRIVVEAKVDGDSLKLNDTYVQFVYNQKMGLPWTTEDFERPSLDGWGRTPTSANTYSWQKVCGPSECIDGCKPMPPIAANGPSGDHTFADARKNGDGCYFVVASNWKTGVYSDAQLLFPCGSVNFSNSQNNRILLSFWYHRFGAMGTQFGSMGDLFIDVHNGTQWVNGVAVIRGVQQGDDADPWQQFQVSLDAFAGVTNGNIRFRAKYLGAPGNMAIDDIELLDRIPDDLSVTKFKRPIDDCGLSNTERVRVEIQNTGINDIIQVNMCYQITFTPFGGDPILLPPVCDSLVGVLISGLNRGATYTYEFPTRADLSQPGKYEFKIYANQKRDGYSFNDTLLATVINETRPFPYCEDFSSWTYGWEAKNFTGGIYPPFWTAARNAYTWKPGIEGGSPTAGHTRGKNDVFIIANDADGMPGAVTQIETPCYDLTNTPTANLEFWFKAPMDGHVMFLDIKIGDAPWLEAEDTLYGNAVFNWTKYEFVLADYVGDFVKFRFRCINAGGYYAIDDMCVIPPPPQQMELERITVPPMGFCQYVANEIATFRIQNTGFTAIDSFRVVLAVDTIFPAAIPGNYFRDTMWFYKGIHYNFFQPGDKIDLKIDSFPINMVRQIRYFFFAHVYLPGDPDTTDNLVREYEILHPVPLQLPYITDFENNANPYNGWLTGQNGFYTFTLKVGVDVPFFTGPADDHTKQNGTGRYFVTQDGGGQAGEAVVLQSQCLDLSQTSNPEISYWYHRHGIHMGEFYLQVNDDYGWETLDSLKGDQHPRGTAPWNNRVIDLSRYAGDFIRVRFLSFRGNGAATDMALDDIAIYDLPPMDLAPDSLCKPTEDINSCYLVNQQVEVRVRNNGADSVDFTQDTANLVVYIDMEGQPWDTLYRSVFVNEWVDQNTGLIRPLPKDSTVCILMDGTFDMYHIDTTFSFHVTVRTTADLINSNDSDSYDVFTREEGGNIAVVKNPNDTVCSGEAVALTLENYFGALSWQERTVNAYDPGFWIPGDFPNNRNVYVSNPDTLTYYRVWVCNHVYSTIDSIVAIRPYAIDTVRVSKCSGDTNDLTFSITVPDNIEKIYIYKNDVRQIFFRDGVFDSLDQANVREAQANAVNDPNGDSNLDDAILINSPTGFVPSGGVVNVTYVNNRSYEDGRGGRILDQTFIDTLYMETYRLGCFSLVNIPILVTIEPSPNLGNMPIPGLVDPARKSVMDTLCSTFDDNKGELLNAGARVGFIYEYDWEIIKYDGNMVPLDTLYDTLQSVTVDPWQLEKNHYYSYQVTVNTPNNCGRLIGTSDKVFRFIDDKCFVGLEERDLSDKMSIYPNPTSEMLFIRYRTQDELKGDISLRDLSGRIIYNLQNVKLNENIQKIDMNELPKGVYFIQIDTPKGRVVEKIVKS